MRARASDRARAVGGLDEYVRLRLDCKYENCRAATRLLSSLSGSRRSRCGGYVCTYKPRKVMEPPVDATTRILQTVTKV